MSALLDRGELLDNRYQLDRVVHRGRSSTLWRASDEVLGRTVAARLIPGRTAAGSKELTALVGRAGQVPDARWVRVLDVGSEGSGKNLTVWVISEWVDGPTLASMLRHEALRGPVATGLVLACAHAVIAAEAGGAAHGALHPDEVLLPPDGEPRLTGLELSAALRTEPAYDDVRGLGALLYASLTARWPLPGWDGLAPPSKGDRLHPRQQRRKVSRELDEITARALSGGYPNAAAFARDLSAQPSSPLHPSPTTSEEGSERAWRRWAWRIVPPLLVATIGLVAWEAGSDLGRIPSPASTAAPALPQAQHVARDGRQVVWVSPPRVTTFDPPGNVPQDAGSLGLAVDGDPSTEWRTNGYPTATGFGTGAHGVGLLLDLRRARVVRVAELLFSAPGADVEIRAGNTRPSRAGALPIVAARSDSAAALRITLAKSVKARYWLVWFTSLPKAASTYRLGVAEIALLR